MHEPLNPNLHKSCMRRLGSGSYPQDAITFCKLFLWAPPFCHSATNFDETLNSPLAFGVNTLRILRSMAPGVRDGLLLGGDGCAMSDRRGTFGAASLGALQGHSSFPGP